MGRLIFDDETNLKIAKECQELRDEHKDWPEIVAIMSEKYGIQFNFNQLRNRLYTRRDTLTKEKSSAPLGKEEWKETKRRDLWIIESTDSRINTWQDAVAKAGVDLDIWEVAEVKVGGWDVTMKIREPKAADKPFRSQNQFIRVTLRRKVPETLETAIHGLLEKLAAKSPIVKAIKRTPLEKLPHRHALEICLPDPHYGLRCFAPGADADWNPALCANMVMGALDKMIALAAPFAPFEQVILPLGNDFFHTDNLWQTTTAGTPQPEADAYFHTFIGGEELAIGIVDKVKQLAPVLVYSIPGNHDRQTSFMLGRILKAYYRNDGNVTIYADESPFKFWEYGITLIGFEHGHSIAAIRLASLMANECPEAWARTQYREWHLGDQHRKGSSKPSAFEEQGVSVEYLPSLVAPNEWHRLKGFNHQKRGAMMFVYSHQAGPIARLQVNVDKVANRIM